MKKKIEEKICFFLLTKQPWILRLLAFFIPIRRDLIVFISWPDKGGNSKALYSYIKKKDANYKLKWIIHERTPYNIDEDSYFKYSFKALLILGSAKFVFNSNNGLERFNKIVKKKQNYVNLWHGMPIKTIYALDKNNFSSNQKKNSMLNTLRPNHDMWCCTSSFYQVVLSSAFQTDITHLPITGQPRNDLMYKNCTESLNKIYCLNNINKVILYAPTYCKTKDVINSDDSRFIQIENCDLKNLNTFLENNNFMLFIKMHPADEDLYSCDANTYSNIKFITRFDLQKQRMDIDDILGAFDMLITDYSSIYIDFLLTNKPIIFAKTNYNEYLDKRGFILGDNYDFFCPGSKCTNYNELIEGIKEGFSQDCYSKEREKIKKLFHKYQDGKSCERIYELMKVKI